jgi:hypothetical protein
MRRRIATVGLATIFAVTATLGVTACGPKTSAAPPPRSELSATEAINAAVGDLAQISYAVEITTTSGTDRESGMVNPTTRSGTLTASSTVQGVPVEVDAVLVSPDMWVKVDLGAMNRQLGIARQDWMKLDAGKVASEVLPIDIHNFNDALDMKLLLAGVDANRSDASHFTGSIDLTRASGVTAPDASEVARAGERARRVPFSASIDQEGRLLEVTIDGGSISPDLALNIRFSDYGTAARVTRPDDNQIVPTPAAVYRILAG